MERSGAYPPIADYGLIGAMHTCALVSRTGSVDWCCLPSFDSPAVFGRLLDWQKGGFFQIAPRNVQSISRRYLPNTNVLETTFQTDTGTATLVDFMPVAPHTVPDAAGDTRVDLAGSATIVLPSEDKHLPPLEEMLRPVEARYQQKIVRILECTAGTVEFGVECRPRFDYGTVVPFTALIEADRTGAHYAFARGGGSAISFYCSSAITIEDHGFHAGGSLQDGAKLFAAATFQPFFLPVAEEFSPEKFDRLLDETVAYWEEWAAQCTYEGEYREDVLRGALALKALTYEPSGAILAAATTSLPEEPAGERNWDYRFTWIRDATLSLEALHRLGYTGEARAYKRWLEWTAAYPEDLQIMYGIRGERWLTEVELPLEGYRWSSPVRIGNGAYTQFQLDIYGEILESAYIYHRVEQSTGADDTAESVTDQTAFVASDPAYWEFLRSVVEFVLLNWRRPDAGIWETRGGYRHFIYSKVMCWVAVDRGIKIAEDLRRDRAKREQFAISDETIARWSAARDEIRQDILGNGYDPNYRAGQGAFVQSYGSKSLDASALMLPIVGFIDANDPMMRSTIKAIQQDLTSPQGFVYRYKGFDDGLAGAEGTFTICTLWLVENLIAIGELRQARTIFETLRSFSNDLGLLSEEINPETGEMLGNFPQAFSHLAFIDNAVLLSHAMTITSAGTSG